MDLLIFEEQRWVLYIFRIGDISVYESQDVLLSPPYPIALLLLKEAQEKELTSLPRAHWSGSTHASGT